MLGVSRAYGNVQYFAAYFDYALIPGSPHRDGHHLVYLLTQSFPPALRDSLLAAFASSDNIGRLGVMVLLIALATILIGIVAAVIVSAATYGVYAVALALAMSGATRVGAPAWRCSSPARSRKA